MDDKQVDTIASSLDEPDVEEFKEDSPDIPWLEGAEKKELVYPDYNPVNTLLTKLELWLLQQPEWAVILAAPRKTRRQAINLVAKRLLTIPNRYQ
jgi:hypothetical protein